MNGRDTVTQPASNWPQIMMQQAVTGKAEMAMSYGSTDIRLEVRGEEVLEAIVAKSSLVLRKIGGGRAGEVAARAGHPGHDRGELLGARGQAHGPWTRRRRRQPRPVLPSPRARRHRARGRARSRRGQDLDAAAGARRRVG